MSKSLTNQKAMADFLGVKYYEYLTGHNIFKNELENILLKKAIDYRRKISDAKKA